jgi:hypothetical protein
MSVKSIVHGLVWTGVVGLAVALSLSSSQDHAVAGSNNKDIPSTWSFHAVQVPAKPQAAAPAQKPAPFDRSPLVRDPAAFAIAKKTADDRAAASHATGGAPLAAASPGPYSVFNGTNFAGLSAGLVTPSDSTGDIGPTSYVEMVNTEIGVRPRTGGGFTTMDLVPFGAVNSTDCLTDPQIAWDQEAGRWFYSFDGRAQAGNNCTSFTNDYVAFGWSKTSDPSDLANGWCKFYFGTGQYLYDYDKLGHDDNFITIGANVFSNYGLGTFQTAVIAVLSKPANGDMTCTLPATVTGFGNLVNADGSPAVTPVPAEMTDSSTYGYILAAHSALGGPQSKIMVWRLSSSGGTPVLTSLGDVTVATFGVPPSAPQPATGAMSCSTAGNCLDTSDGRLTQAVARYDPDVGAEAIWTQHAITDTSVGTLSVERWYELIPGNSAPRQSGNVSGSSLYVFNGAISPAGAGNEAVMFFNTGNSSNYVNLVAMSRSSGSNPGTLANATVISTSTTNDSDFSCSISRVPQRCSWGDYSAARPDPLDTNVVWGTNMLTGTGGTSMTAGWSTQFAAYTPGCDVTTVTPNPGTAISGAVQLFTAAATGCTSPQFEFFLQDTMGNWSLQQGFSSNTTWTWDSTGYPAGIYTIHVWGNQAGDSTAHWESLGSSTITLTAPPPCSSASVSPPNPSSPAGSTINFTATANGCPIPIFAYFIQDPSGTWTLMRSYNTDGTFAWNTSGLIPGTYTVHVWAKQRGDSPSYEAIGTDTVTLTGCTSASISPSNAAQPVGSTVNLTGSAGGGCTSPQFEWFVQYPDGSWNLKRTWGGASFAWDTTGLSPGMYTVHMWANQTGASTATYETLGSATVALNICTGASIAPPSTSAAAGTVVPLTASSTGCTMPSYEFFVQYPNGSWNLKQAWSSSAAFNWDTTGLAPGPYTVHVWANDQGDSTATYEALGASTVTLTGCMTSNAIANPASPQVIGTTIVFTASSTGCTNLVYEFWLLDPAGIWHLVRPFSATTTWTWSSSGYAAGMYTIHVWANNQGADMSTFEANGGPNFTLTTPPPCTAAGIAPPTAGQPAGSIVNMTASSTGCANPQYEFWVLYLDGSWNLKQGFGGATFNWDTTGLAPGMYTVHAWASSTGSGHDSIGEAKVTLTGCATATISPASSNPAAGSMVLLTASATCPSPQFEFFVLYPNGTWYLKRAWSTTTTFSWDTSGLAPGGTYTIHAWANQAGASTATYETYGSATVTLTGCTSAALAPPSGTAAVGAKPTFTASSSGCPNPVYEFWLQYPDGSWHLMRAFSTTTTWTWDTTGLPKGNYVIHVWANNQGADTSTNETYGTATYSLA